MTSRSELKNNKNQWFTKSLLMSIIHKYSEDLLDFFLLSKKLRIHKEYLCSKAYARKIVTLIRTTHIKYVSTQENVKSNKTQ